MSDRDELTALRRLAELEAKAGGAPAAPAPQAPAPSAPGSEPLPSWSDKMQTGATNILKGATSGGHPLFGMATAGFGEGLKSVNDLMNRGAYKAGGAVTDYAAGKGASPELAGGLGYATNVGVQAIPTVLGGLLGKTAGKPVLEHAGKRFMTSALKPSAVDIRSGDAGKAVQTLLDEGINVTPGGVAKLRKTIDALDDEVASRIASSKGTVDLGKQPTQAVVDTLKRFKDQVNNKSDIGAINKAWDEFVDTFGNTMSVQKAQAVKRGTYRAMQGKYGEEGHASTEAQKALARGLREGIEEHVPEVAALNARQGRLINAADQAEYRAAMAANRDIMGLSPAGMNPKAMLAMLADRSPIVKSLIARLLYSGAGPISTGAGAVTGAQMGAQSGRPD